MRGGEGRGGRVVLSLACSLKTCDTTDVRQRGGAAEYCGSGEGWRFGENGAAGAPLVGDKRRNKLRTRNGRRGGE